MNLRYITYPLNGLLMMGMPLLLGIYLTRRWKMTWRLFGIGALTFVASQVGHIPFNNYVLNPALEALSAALPEGIAQTLLVAAGLGLSSGLFEEIARYIAYAKFIPEARSWRQGILFGAGHGGIEAIIFGGLVLLGFVNATAATPELLAAQLPPDQAALAQQQIEAYWNTPLPITLLGAVERALTIPVHIAMALMVLQSFVSGKKYWLFLSIGWHALLNGAAVTAMSIWQNESWAFYAVEGLLSLFTLASLLIIYKLWRPAAARAEAAPQAIGAGVPSSLSVAEIKPVQEDDENLDNTRYQ